MNASLWSWPKSVGVALLWAVAALVVLIPFCFIATDRFLPFGGLDTLAWGPALVGIIAGLVHGNVRVGLLAGFSLLVLGVVWGCVMFVLALRSLPGP
jgi:hypothetical protein